MLFGMLIEVKRSGVKMNQKHVFWQALIVTVFIFALGILSGLLLENWRTSTINTLYSNSEIELLDIKLQQELFSSNHFNCDYAIKANINFADKIYEEAKLLGEYEKASRLTNNLITQHKKYDILRAMVLANSLNIKSKCNNTYFDVVYFYQYNAPSLDTKARQDAFSKVLEELKNKYGNKILLLPISGDNQISSIDLIMNNYNITEKDLPIIVINGKNKVKDLESMKDLEKYF